MEHITFANQSPPPPRTQKNKRSTSILKGSKKGEENGNMVEKGSYSSVSVVVAKFCTQNWLKPISCQEGTRRQFPLEKSQNQD